MHGCVPLLDQGMWSQQWLGGAQRLGHMCERVVGENSQRGRGEGIFTCSTHTHTHTRPAASSISVTCFS